MIKWESGNRKPDGKNEVQPPSAQLKLPNNNQLDGTYIAYIASRFQQDMIANVVWYLNRDAGCFPTVMLALYHCIAVDISHMFTKPAWLALDCALPVMPLKLSYDQAIAALQHAENSLENLHLEAIFLVPTLYTVGVQMIRKPDQRRVVDFIGKLKQRGFLVTDQFRSAIEGQWIAN